MEPDSKKGARSLLLLGRFGACACALHHSVQPRMLSNRCRRGSPKKCRQYRGCVCVCKEGKKIVWPVQKCAHVWVVGVCGVKA